MNKKEQEKQDAIKCLKRDCKIKPGSTIIVNQTHVSSSGMSRRLELYVIDKKNNRLNRITYQVGKALEWNVNEKGLKVDGSGMDMPFHTISCLTWVLFRSDKLKSYKGNGGSCINWQSI